MVFQMFNNKIKAILRDKEMVELVRGKYYDPREIQVKHVGLNVLQGFKLTLASLKKGLHLQIDVCSRVFRSLNLAEEMQDIKSEDRAKAFEGSLVITNYGTRRTYKILEIDQRLCPKS